MKKFFPFYVLFGFVVLLITTSSVLLFQPVTSNQKEIFEIVEGTSIPQVSEDLYDRKIIVSPLLMKSYGLFSGKSKIIQSGEYEILSTDSIVKLVEKFSQGNIFYRQIRLREGSTFSELLSLLKENHYLIDNLQSNYEEKLIKKLNISHEKLEGLFFPDTYFYKKNDTYEDILRRAYLKQKINLDKLWKNKRLDLPYTSDYEALTLASIIEKEGVEKNQIAGVFIRRLKLGMKLQSDPTVIYSLGKDFDGDIKKADLKMRHPYNTYVQEGLPPSPIGLVSLESLNASFHPDDSSSLYFVSKGNGYHKFSDTLEEHNQAVYEYQLIRNGK